MLQEAGRIFISPGRDPPPFTPLQPSQGPWPQGVRWARLLCGSFSLKWASLLCVKGVKRSVPGLAVPRGTFSPLCPSLRVTITDLYQRQAGPCRCESRGQERPWFRGLPHSCSHTHTPRLWGRGRGQLGAAALSTTTKQKTQQQCSSLETVAPQQCCRLSNSLLLHSEGCIKESLAGFI